MQVHSFIAESAADAVAQIRENLGPNAVVLHVRQASSDGLSRFWRGPRIEVLAGLPEEKPADSQPESLPAPPPLVAALSAPPALPPSILPSGAAGPGSDLAEKAAKLLRDSGLLPVPAQVVVNAIRFKSGAGGPATLGETIEEIRAALISLWKPPPPLGRRPRLPHVLVGAAGAGKTTCICKWLAQTILVEGRSARVWRLDSSTANTADFLDVYCDILGATAERTWPASPEASEFDMEFIDLPGVDWRNPSAMADLARQLRGLSSPRVHLVLNAAYESSLLVEQARAFSVLPVEDLIVTHLDEEPRWGKLWNLALGTNYSIRFLGDGQNIPGNFHLAGPERILARQLPAR
jgi:flagellar biosynthesis protein FlhF